MFCRDEMGVIIPPKLQAKAMPRRRLRAKREEEFRTKEAAFQTATGAKSEAGEGFDKIMKTVA